MIRNPNWKLAVGHFRCPRCGGGAEVKVSNAEFRPFEVLKCDFCNALGELLNPVHNTMLDDMQAARLEQQRRDFFQPWRTATPVAPYTPEAGMRQLARLYGRLPFRVRVIGETGEY